MLQELGIGQGYLKAGFFGFAGTGKTHTATLLALGLMKHLNLKGKVAFFDTEGGIEYVAPMIREATGANPIGLKSRSFDDLLAFGKECVDPKNNVAVAIADSMSHVWEDIRKSYLAKVNEGRLNKGLSPRSRLEFQDWDGIKGKFGQWTDFFLNAPLHIIVCGRAGYEYDYDQNEETGKKELVKTGVKMRTEGQFGFEPSLLVEMDRLQDRVGGKLSSAITIRATVVKDRFNKINGRQFENPTFDSFLPHVQSLTPGILSQIDTTIKTDVGVDENGDAAWQRERRERAILCEEIQGEMMARWPSQTAAEKKAKADVIDAVFNTKSWTKVETLSSDVLRAGLIKIRAEYHVNAAEPVAAE